MQIRKGYKIAHFRDTPRVDAYREDTVFKIAEKANETIKMFKNDGIWENNCRIETKCFLDQIALTSEIGNIVGNNAPIVFDFHTNVRFHGLVAMHTETDIEFHLDEEIDEEKLKAHGDLLSVEYFPGEEPK